MADVRAEILAASRSRTGWLDGTVQATESQPFVSKVKSNFEEKTINQDNKLSSNASKSEAVRRLGSKVSSIATLFQSFSPHRNDCSKSSNVAIVNRGGSEKNVQKTISEQANKIDSDSEYKCFTQGENESHQKRFNSARAIFEQLGEKSKENSRLSDSSRNDSLHLEDASSSKYSMHEKDNVSSQSNRYSSQSSPDEELYSTPFCHNSFVHSAGVQFEDGRSSKTVSETSSSLHSERQNHKFLSDCTSNFSSQYSQIYEEIPPKDSSKNSRILSPKTCDHFDSNMKTKEDKNANTTNSYNECFVAHSNSNSIEADVDSSIPIYAKVVKKRSKVVSNFNHDTEAEQSSAAPANVDVVKTTGYKSAEAEKFEVPDRRSEAHQKSWENLGISSSNVWKKKASENSSDQDDNEAEGFYGISSDLRDAAGETLAEFESREHELFFVEAVLRSQHQGNLDEPFPNHKHNTSSDSKVDFMTQEEADHFLSSRPKDVSKDKHDLQSTINSQNVVDSDQSETWSVPNSVTGEIDEDDLGSENCSQTIAFPPGTNVLYEDVNYHILPDGHFVTELPGLEEESEDEDIFCPVPPKKKTKVRFNYEPIKVYSTYSVDDYDRHNDDVDPVAASAEYELEKRIEKMDVFPVDLVKGSAYIVLSEKRYSVYDV